MLERASRQVGRALGLSASLVFALFLSVRIVRPVVARVTPKLWNATIASEALWGKLKGADEKVGVSQFVAFVATMVVIVAVTATYSWPRTRVERLEHARRLASVMDIAVAVFVVVVASRRSPFGGALVIAVLVVGTSTLVGYTGLTPEPRRSTDRSRAVFVVAAEAIALGWGLWLTGAQDHDLLLPL